jgi:hypothetical protein
MNLPKNRSLIDLTEHIMKVVKIRWGFLAKFPTSGEQNPATGLPQRLDPRSGGPMPRDPCTREKYTQGR